MVSSVTIFGWYIQRILFVKEFPTHLILEVVFRDDFFNVVEVALLTTRTSTRSGSRPNLSSSKRVRHTLMGGPSISSEGSFDVNSCSHSRYYSVYEYSTLIPDKKPFTALNDL